MHPLDDVAGHAPSPVSLTLVAMVLAVVTGFVDAVGFLHVVAVVLFAYVGGAAVGASPLGDRTGFLVPAALVAAVLAFAWARPWS